MIEYTLKKGSHASPHDGLCAMEWISYLNGYTKRVECSCVAKFNGVAWPECENCWGQGYRMEWDAERYAASDQPGCVSPILRLFCIGLNDGWDGEMRQRLRPYLARCIGTADDGRDEERGYLCLDWQIRTFLPAWLRLAGLTGEAERVEALAPITDLATAKLAGPVVRKAQSKAYAARAAARAAAWDSARAALDATRAARAAAWDSAGDAARAALDATRAAGDAAYAAARDATRAAAWAAAWDATRDAAWAAAWDATRDAAWAAGDAAYAAARDATRAAAWAALKPTVTALQQSALDLLDRMLPTEAVTLPAPAQAEYDRLLVEVAPGAMSGQA